MLNKMNDQIVTSHPFWRMVFFPFYTLRQSIFVLSLVVLLTAFAWFIDAPGSLIQYSTAAYIGAVIMAYFASPSHMVRPTSDKTEIETYLRSQDLIFDNKNTWTPKIPKYLLYSHTNVKITKTNGDIRIDGPYQFLIELRDHLRGLRR